MAARRPFLRSLLAAATLAVTAAGCASAEPATTPVTAVDEDAAGTPDATADDPLATFVAAAEVETIPVFLARDPFRPLVTPTAGGGAVPGDPTDPAPTDPAPDGCVTTAAGEVCDGELVELVDVREDGGTEQAVVRVDGNVYLVEEGDRFATSYLAESIDPPCASFLYGDELFTLCEGQQVLK